MLTRSHPLRPGVPRAAGTLTLALLFAAGCGSSSPGTTTDTDLTDADTGGDAVEDTGTDATPDTSCTPGEEGCACPEGGECFEDLLCNEETSLCEPCPFGDEGCRCIPSVDPSDDPTCNDDLTCTEDDRCECVPGTENCPCASGDACDDGLECIVGVCAEPGCVPGTTGCPCDGGACAEETDFCSDRAVCEECNANALGCACTTSCSNGFVCDSGFCRDAVTCATAGCAPQQLCDEGTGRDAVCLDDCELGYVWNSTTRSCDEAPNCDECTADNRTCSLATGEPVCGGCVEGWLEDSATGECVDVVTCDELDCAGRCREATVVDGVPQDAECNDRPCEDGYLLASGGACVECSQCYTFPGGVATPRDGVIGNEVDPFSGGGVTSACVCQFDPESAGRFQNVETGQITTCDADRDGWVNVRFMDVLNLAIDRTRNRFLQNATCDLRSVDRFELVSDDARTAVRTVTVEEVVAAYGLGGSQYLTDDGGTRFVYLVEPEETDQQSLMAFRYGTTALNKLSNYPGGTFLASEVNPMVRACNFATAVNDDLNLDGAVDVTQSQDVSFTPTGTRPTAVFYHMSYFMELSRAYFRARPGSTHGSYVIVEKGRSTSVEAEVRLELTYTASSGPYWRECMRSRDAEYPAGATLPGSTPATEAPLNFEFARWHECDINTPGEGNCQISDADAEDPRRGRGPYIAYDGRRPITAAARYDEASDGVWPGMNHHSQFKCMALGTESNVGTNPNGHVTLSQLSSGSDVRQWTLVECRLAPVGTTTRTVGSDPGLNDMPNPADPQFACSPVTDPAQLSAFATASESSGRRFWVVANYNHYAPDATDTTYVRGCINEAMEWPFLCNGYDPVPYYSTAVPSGTLGNFGRLVCGCSVNTGGPECDVGCPTNNVHYGGTWTDDASGSFACTNGYCLTHSAVPEEDFAGGRRGFWMCGDFAATAFPDSSVPPEFRSPDFAEGEGGAVTGWQLRGEIPTAPFHRVRLTEPGAAEGSGWSVY